MVTKEDMDLLKGRFVNAKTAAERNKVRKEIKRACNDDAKAVAGIAVEQVKETLARIDTALVRNQLEEILAFTSLAYIAKTYFGKTRQWLYQRINGLTVNGKPAQFTAEEMSVLNSALQDMGRKLMATHIS